MHKDPSSPRADSTAPVSKHESIRVTRASDELRFEFDWHTPKVRRHFRLALAATVLLFGGPAIFSPSARWFLPLVCLLAYVLLANAVDRTIVVLRRGKLRSLHRPCPWPQCKTVRVEDIERVWTKRERGDADRREAAWREAVAMVRFRPRSRKAELFREYGRSGSEYDARVRFVVQELKRELRSGRWGPVRLED
jgi:hypothetical protein